MNTVYRNNNYVKKTENIFRKMFTRIFENFIEKILETVNRNFLEFISRFFSSNLFMWKTRNKLQTINKWKINIYSRISRKRIE